MHCPHCQAPNADGARFCGACGQSTTGTDVSGPGTAYTAAPLIGRVIAGRYRILAKLGEGGMGAVFQAEQLSLKRTIAIKLLKPEVAASPLLLRRFNAEAEAVAKLRHPNTINIYDFGQDSDGVLFIAMELIEGRSLREVLRNDAPLPIRRALAIASQVAASLSDAHARTIVHRDLKPDNVMLTDRGRAKDSVTVLDFGIAKLRDDSRATQHAMTQAGDMLGTPQYMAPEQIRGEVIDGRTDVYALGCMLYEMVTGRLPYEAPNVMALLSKHLLEHAPPPSQARPDAGIPPEIDALVMAAMAKDVAARPATMDEYGEQIAALLATMPAEASAVRSAIGPAMAPSGQASAQSSAQPPMPTPASYPHAQAYPQTYPLQSYPSPPQHTPPPYPSYPTPAAQQPASSKALIWALVALIAVLGGAGVYVATRDGKQDAPPVAEPTPGSNAPVPVTDEKDPWAPKPSEPPTVPSKPAEPTDPAEPDDIVEDEHDQDHDHVDNPSGKHVDIAQGVKVIALPGMAVKREKDGSVLIGNDKFAIFGGPLTHLSNDPNELVQAYIKEIGARVRLRIADTTEHMVAGERRKVFRLTGAANGFHFVHLVIPIVSPGFRVGVVIHMAGKTNPPPGMAKAYEILHDRILAP